MDICIKKAPSGGAVRAVTSKTSAHRLLICAALSDKKTFVECTDTSNDIDATCACLNAFGAVIERADGGFSVTPVDLKKLPSRCVAFCGASGSTLRFLLPVAAALGINTDFMPEDRLPERPLSPLYEELERHGISLSQQGAVPFNINGKLPCGEYSIAANVSSQFISGLLFALPLLNGNSSLKLYNKFESRPYVEMTLDAIKQFGVNIDFTDDVFYINSYDKYTSPSCVSAEGDWSNAAFWLAAGAVGKHPVTVTGLNFSSLQGDKAVIDVLKQFGAKIETDIVNGCCTVFPSELRGIEIDAENIPDLVPVLSLVALNAEGKTRIFNAARLRIKECDRLAAVKSVFTNLGGDITETDDGLIIKKSTLHGGVCDSFNDHRMAMTEAVASVCVNGEITVLNALSVKKSYPRFWQDFTSLGAVTE